MEAVKTQSLGQIKTAFYGVGGKYRGRSCQAGVHELIEVFNSLPVRSYSWGLS
jgi:hypothetical protein